jgi:aspartyl-tRNA synthetase
LLLTDGESIRDVMAFPKTASGQDPMTDAPDRVEEGQLRELHLQAAMPETGPA